MNNEIWAEYIITEVSENNGVITHVHIGEDSYAWNPAVRTEPVSYVINLLNKNKDMIIVTVHKDKNRTGVYQKGAKVKVHSFNGKDYLKSSLNDSTLDNLDNLPRF